jgi:hypothetical protein
VTVAVRRQASLDAKGKTSIPLSRRNDDVSWSVAEIRGKEVESPSLCVLLVVVVVVSFVSRPGLQVGRISGRDK